MTTPVNNQQGFTYLLLLIALTLLSLSLLKSRDDLQMRLYAQQEDELLFRGEQIRAAIDAYRQAGGASGCFPVSFQQLLVDKRGLVPRYHLRQLYADPLTGKRSWGMIYDSDGRWIGVHSLGAGVPRRKTGFPRDAKTFAQATSYRQWRFQLESDALAPLPAACGK